MGMQDGLWVMITDHASWVVANEFFAHSLGTRRLGSKNRPGRRDLKNLDENRSSWEWGLKKFGGGGVRGAPAW